MLALHGLSRKQAARLQRALQAAGHQQAGPSRAAAVPPTPTQAVGRLMRRSQEVEGASRQLEHRLREKRQQLAREETLDANAVGMLGEMLGKLQ
jgi:hypothetical protein